MARISVSVINDLTGDQRIHRIASTLQEAGHQVTVIGRVLPESLPLGDRPYATHRMKLWFRAGKLFYLEYNLRLFLFLLTHRFDIQNANDLDSLLANFLTARLKGRKLVYDSHEYFTEVPELVHRPATQKVWLWLEQWIFPKLTYAYTVNQSIANIYSRLYQVSVGVVRNVPFRRHLIPQRHATPILIYQGALNLGRGVDLMIRATKHLPGHQLWIIGKGDVEPELRELTRELALEDRVIFYGFMPFDQLVDFTRQAWLGLSLEEDLGGNYHFVSPNKLYDYIQAHVPVLVSDLPEMRAVVEQHQVGEILPKDERTPDQLAERIKLFLADKQLYEGYVTACEQAAGELCWEKERETLLAFYSL
ncbi:MAG: glycosyltransferase [Bacteroidota bacterium]